MLSDEIREKAESASKIREGKYELTPEIYEREGFRFRQIRALYTLPGRCRQGDLGGFIAEGDGNGILLSQRDDCWISTDVWMFPHSIVMDNAFVTGHLYMREMSHIFENAVVSIDGEMRFSQIHGDALVGGEVANAINAINATIVHSKIHENVKIFLPRKQSIQIVGVNLRGNAIISSPEDLAHLNYDGLSVTITFKREVCINIPAIMFCGSFSQLERQKSVSKQVKHVIQEIIKSKGGKI